MKQIAMLIGSILLVTTAVQGAPKATFPESTHDFGVIREVDGPASFSFPMVNGGDEPLVILTVRATCGCTTPKFSRQPVAPGDTTWIDVAYDPSGRPGRFEKKIYVETNTEPERSTLVVKGSVIGSEETVGVRYPYTLGPARLRDKFIVYGDVLTSDSKGRYIEAYNVSSDTIHPRAVSSSRVLNVIVQPAAVPPGEQFIYSVVLSSDKHGQWGPQTETLTLWPDTPSDESLDVQVTYNVKESFGHLDADRLASAPKIAADDTRIDLGRVSRSQTESLKVVAKISNRGSDALKVRRVYVPDTRLNVRMKDDVVKKNKSTELTITINPQDFVDADMINATVDIITNDPAMPVMTLRVVGELVE